MKKIILIILSILFIKINLSAQEIKNGYQHIFLEEVDLINRVGLKYEYKDHLEKQNSQKEQKYTFFGEFAFWDYFSLYIHIPYTLRWIEGSEERKYIDHIRVINKLQFRWKNYLFYSGILLDLPRNHDKAGDVPKNLGYIEPYLGVGFFYDSFVLKFTVRWNTQSNTKFKEEENQQFERKWKYDLSMGIVYKNWQFWLEAQYQYLYDPKQIKQEAYFIGPSIAYNWNQFVVSLIYLIPSEKYSFNREVRIQIQKLL